MRPWRRQCQLLAPWCSGWRLIFLVSALPDAERKFACARWFSSASTNRFAVAAPSRVDMLPA